MAADDLTHRTRSTGQARREDVLAAAARVFAARGLYGTPTTDIAMAAGISHGYLFRLFPTKSALFRALARRCNERILAAFGEAAAAARLAGEPVLPAIGAAYGGLLADRSLLLVQLHAHAACADAGIREEMRDGFARLIALVEHETAAEPAEIRAFFAEGMLLNVLAAMGEPSFFDLSSE